MNGSPMGESGMVATFAALVAVMFILFAGTPDLMDALLYKVTDGAYELPAPEVDE